MANADVTAVIEAVLKDDQFNAAIARMSAKAKQAEKEVGGLTGILEKLMNPGAIVGGFIGVAAIEGIKKLADALFNATKEAGEFVKSQEAFESVFRGVGKEADLMRQRLATDLNLSTAETTKFLTSIQKVQLGLGLTGEQAMKFSGQALEVAKALSEFGTGTVQGNMDALQKAFLGQTRGLKELGVTLDDNEILLRAQAAGYEIVGGKVTQATREMVIMDAVQKANKGAMENAKKESKSFTETLEMLTARAADLKLAFGIELQNAFKGSSDSFVPFIKAIATLDNMRLVVMKVGQTLSLLVSTMMIGFRALIAPVEIGIRTIVGAFNFLSEAIQEGPRQAMKNVFEMFKHFASKMLEVGNDLGDIFGGMAKLIKAKFTGTSEDVKKEMDAINGSINKLGKDVSEVLPSGLGSAGDVFKKFTALMTTGKKDLDAVSTSVAGIGEAATGTTDKLNISASEWRSIMQGYFKYIEDERKADTISAKEEFEKQKEGLEKLLAAGKIGSIEYYAKLERLNEQHSEQLKKIDKKYYEGKIKDIDKVYKHISNAMSMLTDAAVDIFRASLRDEEEAIAALIEQIAQMDANRAAEMMAREEADYATSQERLERSFKERQDAINGETDTLKKALDQRALDEDIADNTIAKNRHKTDVEAERNKKALEEERDRQEKKLKREKWEADHALALSKAAFDTAAAVIAGAAALPVPPFPFGIAAGVLGAVQIGIIASEKMPAFARGGVSSGGPAIVGEEGPELVDLPPGARVIPADKTARLMSGLQMPRSNNASFTDARSSSTSSDNRQFNFSANGVNDPMEFIRRAQRQFGADVFNRK